ncbi:MAG: DUF1364 domain-containing protein [Oceanobacter sp.]
MLLKSPSVRSPKILKAAKGQNCTMQVAGVCNHNPETTVAAHLDSENKGMGYKSSDLFTVFACSACHEWLDRHQGSAEDQLFYSLRALDRTHRQLHQMGVIKCD